MSNFDFVGIEKMVERMLEVALTKSRVSMSSLSKVNTWTESGCWIAFHRLLSRSRLNEFVRGEEIPMFEDRYVRGEIPDWLVVFCYSLNFVVWRENEI